jgi:hypothetical protein
VKVEELRYVLRCEVSGRSYEVQVWADPAFLGARVLVGQVIEDEKTGEGFLFVEKWVYISESGIDELVRAIWTAVTFEIIKKTIRIFMCYFEVSLILGGVYIVFTILPLSLNTTRLEGDGRDDHH